MEYENLSDELKRLYDKIYMAYNQRNIIDLREEAKKMFIESPTTLSKENLVKRITDRVISDYLPKTFIDKEINFDFVKHGIFSTASEFASGVVDVADGKYKMGNILIPSVIANEAAIRHGDLVEGSVSDLSGTKTLFAISFIDGLTPDVKRRNFDEIPIERRRPFEPPTLGTPAERFFPDLYMGERVIVGNMTKEYAERLAHSFKCGVALFVGLDPEIRSFADKNFFVVPFDYSKQECLRVARTALERAKRLSERGKNVVFVIYGFDSIGDRDVERAIFGSSRCFECGSITVIADVNKDRDMGAYSKVATRIVENTEVL